MTVSSAHQRRHGLTLLELLVVLAMIVVMVGLLLPAIQKSRELATRIQSQNKLRQIGLGFHNYAGDHGQLPGFAHSLSPDPKDNPPLAAILPYLEARPAPRIPLYIDPADPTSNLQFGRSPRTQLRGNSGYAINKLAFDGLPTLVSDFADGTSTTLAVVEHYSRCGPYARYNFIYSLRYSVASGDDGQALNEIRRASFADAYYGDVVPVADGAGSVRPSRVGATFQVRPTADQCDPSIPQTGFASGMPSLFFDGSVRIIPSAIEPAVFWATVTRNGGEVIVLD